MVLVLIIAHIVRLFSGAKVSRMSEVSRLLEKEHSEISMSRHTGLDRRVSNFATLPRPLRLLVSSPLKEGSISQDIV